ncbi:hypothetical protein OSTOST_08578 [Ostertagia ostertagi]
MQTPIATLRQGNTFLKEQQVEVPISRQTAEAEAEARADEEQKVRLVAVRFAESFTENVMSQAQSDLRSSVRVDESIVKITAAPGAKILEEKVTETVEVIPTISTVAPPQTSTMVTKSAQVLEEIINAGMTTIDVRKPNVQFDHVVTVVEPEVVQLGLRLSSPSVPSMKFIDLETILQRPGTSSSANTLITITSARIGER